MEIIRHGDLLIIQADSMPAGLTPKQDRVLLEGEATNHFHRLDKANVFLADRPASRDTDYLIGYFEVSEEANLTHEEHETIKLPKGIYRYYHQREYSEIDERPVID